MTRGDRGVPEGHLVALTWEVPPSFGGLTKAMLQRSGLLHESTGRPVTVVTLAHQTDLDERREDIRARGLLSDGVQIVNLWEDLATYDGATLASAPYEDTAGTMPEPVDGQVVDEVRRADGSLLARQLWVHDSTRPPLSPFGDRVLHTDVWSPDGSRVGGWSGSWPLWRWWLERYLGTTPTHLIVDSAFVIDCLAVAPLPVPTTWVVHNAHLEPGRRGDYGPVERWRAFSLPRSGAFDAVVYLTTSQRDAAGRLLGPRGAPGRTYVVPNALPAASRRARARRPRAQGIVMANFEKRKRLDHAVRAVASAADAAPEVTLRMFGTGSLLEDLERLVEQTHAPVDVIGYTTSPAERFDESSFMLLTSSREGLPLVLAEAMSAGCVPLAYDIPYGPADVITDGVNGYLVKSGDVDALAERIASFVTASRWRRSRMRRAARRRARDFAPPAVAKQWAEVLSAAADHAARRTTPDWSASALAATEHAAMGLRLHPPRVELIATDLAWAGPVLTMGLHAALEGGRLDAPLQLEVDAVHIPSGTRAAEDAVRSTPVSSGPHSASVNVVVDTEQLATTPGGPTGLDHVLLVSAHSGPVTLLGTVTGVGGPVSLAPASTRRPTAVVEKARGMCLVTASPSVAGQVTAGPDGISVVHVRSLDGATVEGVSAVGTEGSATVEARPTPDGWSLLLPTGGTWTLRATVAGKARDVAWEGPSPETTPGTAVTLTPRGYTHLTT